MSRRASAATSPVNKSPKIPENEKMEKKLIKSSSNNNNGVMVFGVRLENRLNMKDLEVLQTAFMSEGDGYDSKLSLDKDQFCQLLEKNLNKGSKEEFLELFDKVDVAREGSVDWDKFASHLLLEYHEKDDRVKSTQVPQWKDLKTLPSPHKDIIQSVAFLKNTSRYIAISKEGGVSTWDYQLRIQRNIKLTNDSVKPRDLWVTQFVPLQNINKIAIAFTSKEIAFYDMSSKLEFNCQYKIHGLPHTPISMNYWSDSNNINRAILVFGDTGGCVNALVFSSANIALFDRPPGPSAGENKEQITIVDYKKLCNNAFKNCKLARHNDHTEWTRQVKYSQHLECFISCSTTYENSLVLGWIEKGKKKMKTNVFSISQGINAFDYHETFNQIATAGVNHHVCLWNPYVLSKPVGLLRGHMAAVIQVQFVYSRGQLISFSKDKVLRIWDVQLQVCLQRMAGMFPKGPEVYSTLFFHEDRNRLFATFNYQLTVMEMKPEIKDRVLSHDKPVTCAIYNSTFNQVVSACQASTVVVWMLDTGQKVKQFLDCHGISEITTLALDSSETRLYTGSTDGTVKVWDFNGHCHHTLNAGHDRPADITQIVPLKRLLLLVGWDKFITVFRNQQLTQFHVQPSEWKGGQEHQDDIMAAAFSSPSMLATGSYDGEIVIWNTNSEVASKHIRHRFVRKTTKSRAGTRQKSAKSQGLQSEGSEARLVRSQQTLTRDTTKSRETFKTQGSLEDLGAGSGDGPLPLQRDKTVSLQTPLPEVQETQESEDDYGQVITRLIFLEARKGQAALGGANLVSCGGNGWVRFWNTAKNLLLAEFVAHLHVSVIVMASDDENHYLVTANPDGCVKAWNIEEYCTVATSEIITMPPPMTATWQPHVDAINHLHICKRYDRLLVISSSTDCSVALWDIYGNHIGIFGQENHWKIEQYIPSEENNSGNEGDEDEGDLSDDSVASKDSGWEPPQHVDPKERINSWENSKLGKEYQEARSRKRERQQPGTIPNLPYLTWEKTGQPPAGPYAALNTQDLVDVGTLHKPDFIIHPERYFRDHNDVASSTVEKIPSITDGLKRVIEERDLFPKEILEEEARRRAALKSERRASKPKRLGSRGWNSSTSSTAASVVANLPRGSVSSKQGLSPLPEGRKSSLKSSATPNQAAVGGGNSEGGGGFGGGGKSVWTKLRKFIPQPKVEAPLLPAIKDQDDGHLASLPEQEHES